MRARLRSTRARLLMAAFGSAILALTLLTVNPFPSDVLGQATAPVPSAPATASVAPGATVTVGGVTVVNQSSQPANVQLQGNMLTIAAPAGFTVVVEGASCAPVDGQTNVVTCTVAPGARVTFTSVAGVSRQPAPSAPAPAAPQPAAPQPAAPQAPAVAPAPVPQRPAVSAAPAPRVAALPSTGAPAAAESGLTANTVAGYGLLALAAALVSAVAVLSLRQRSAR